MPLGILELSRLCNQTTPKSNLTLPTYRSTHFGLIMLDTMYVRSRKLLHPAKHIPQARVISQLKDNFKNILNTFQKLINESQT